MATLRWGSGVVTDPTPPKMASPIRMRSDVRHLRKVHLNKPIESASCKWLAAKGGVKGRARLRLPCTFVCRQNGRQSVMGLGIFTQRCQLSFLSYYLNFTLTDGYSNSNEKAYVDIRFLMNVIQSKQYVSGDFYFLIMTPIFKKMSMNIVERRYACSVLWSPLSLAFLSDQQNDSFFWLGIILNGCSWLKSDFKVRCGKYSTSTVFSEYLCLSVTLTAVLQCLWQCV